MKFFRNIVIFAATGTLLISAAAPASAATFSRSLLIDDALFTDTDSMTISEIQAFLEAKGSLLANWKDDVDMKEPVNDCVVHKATGKSAARLIWEAANRWGAQIVENCEGTNVSYWSDADYSNYTLKTVSPKALLVLLEKENNVVTAEGTYSKNYKDYQNPSCCSNEYKLAWATGYGVPTDGSTDREMVGFYNQINWAAWVLRYAYERSAGNVQWDEVEYKQYTGPMTRGTWRICGYDAPECEPTYFDGYRALTYDRDDLAYPPDERKTVNVFMGSRATASLYSYTPHTYSSNVENTFYGNYNFFHIYDKWFGSPILPTYEAELVGRSNMFGIKPGLSKRVFLAYRNTGNATWYDASKNPSGTPPVVLATSNGLYRNSIFNGSWDRNNRPKIYYSKVYKSDGKTLAVDQSRVKPKQIVKFVFDMTAPMNIEGSKIYNEWFEPLRQYKVRMDAATPIKAEVPKLTLEGANAGTSGYRGARPGWTLRSFVKVKNTGNVVWYDSVSARKGVQPVILSVRDGNGFNAGYTNSRRATTQIEKVYKADGNYANNQHTVRPGETAVFRFDITIPEGTEPGNYTETYQVRFAGEPRLTASPELGITTKVLQSLN